ncbi:Imm26 family immunity protein [Massilia sp. DJPM01]|uniref:Imm26 family immunity protein n=1 Tax=Massilia sp. DJPM01 TaxID=3024404 RepID=UPI00259D5ABB|nr:Imm26 family immunity protein [Massilia sp. DJPM01]MDM5181660.1 Imm26 family immunity protein [Massilia sp. DJPM01]
MGWWSAPDNPEVTVGDAVLDSVRHFLRDFSREYQEDLSRKPTLQELEYALNLAFRVNVDSDILDGFDELEIKQVVLKTAKRPKKQKVTPGDIFAYKLEDGRFGFGRIISDASLGAFAEIFDYFADQPVFDYSKLDKWLVPPVPIESYSLLEVRSMGDWRIIGHTPGFAPGSQFNSLRYVYGSSPNTLVATDVFGKKEPISAADAKGLPEYCAYDDLRFRKLVAPHVPPLKNTK